MKLVSFDLFDTTLIRKCGGADNVFWIMAKKLFPEDIDKQCKFVMWRKTTNCTVARKNVNYTLDDIYSKDVNTLFGYSSKFLLKTEYKTEAEMLVANPAINKKIKEEKSKGNNIAYISDIYLSSTFLKDILVREGLYKDSDELFVSCECNARKDNGTLFDYVRKRMNPSTWIHYGDNELSDFRIPRKKGVKANLVNFGYTNIEKQFNKYTIGIECESDYSILIGYLRYLRLTGNSTPEDSFAIDYIAPLYYGYVKHILDNAKNRGIKMLYFLSRDGYIFLKIAEQIPHDGIELKYLYISRKSIQPAFRYIATDEEYSISTNSEIKEREHQVTDKESYDLLDAYLGQEGVYEEQIAMVDLGWFGSTRLIINKLREQRGASQCFFYYLGVVNNCIPEIYGKYNAYTYSEKFANNCWHTFLLEEYFSLCPNPTTIAYKKEGNRVVPVFRKEEIKCQSIVEANINNCCRFAKENIPVDSNAIHYFALNSFCNMDVELNKEYVELLFKVCRHEDFIFRRFSKMDLYPYIRNRRVTLNDKLAFDTSFDIVTKSIVHFLHKVYTIVHTIKHKCLS